MHSHPQHTENVIIKQGYPVLVGQDTDAIKFRKVKNFLFKEIDGVFHKSDLLIPLLGLDNHSINQSINQHFFSIILLQVFKSILNNKC